MTTVLLVEDEANSIALALRAFRTANMPPPKVVNDGEAAIAYLNGNGEYANRSDFPLPNLILLDLNAPKKDGFEVLEWLRAQSSAAIKHIPVAALTTREIPDEMKRAYDLGASLYLVKPLTAKSLGDSIDRLVVTFDPPQRIMICDDDPDHRALVEGELCREFPQAQIEHVADMESFVGALNLGPFDLVITELHLKSLNGLTILRTVKAHWAFCSVIMITRHGNEEIAVEAMKAGLDDYVLKSPEHFIRFNSAVHTALSRVSVRRAKLRAEEALKRSEEKHRLVLSNVDEIVYQLSLLDENNLTHTAVNFVSDQVEKIIGYTPEEFVGNASLWFNAIHPDDVAKVLASTQRLPLAREGVLREYRLRHKHTGEYHWLEDHVLPQFDPNGKLIGAFGVARDVTERKQDEALLRQSEERYRTLAEAASDMIFIINREGQIEYVNRSAASRFRAEPEQIVGKLMMHIFPPEIAARQLDVIQKVIETGEPYYAETQSAFPGGEAWLSTSLVPLKNEEGSVRAVLGVARDITEQQLLLDNLQLINAHLNLSYDETLESWARIADLHAHNDEKSTRHATDLALQLARALGVKEVDLTDLRRGALLHDVGSLMIPDNILLKADPLTTQELKVIRQHPDYSRQMLSTIRQLQRALDIPYHHHENWDGSGYPLGLKGEEIPIAARIFAVVDVWTALRSARPYRAAWSNEKARQYLRSMAGVQFDPKVVEAFLTMDAGTNL